MLDQHVGQNLHRAAQFFAVAQQTGTQLGATAGLYTSLARSAKNLGVSQADIITATTAVSQAFQVSGAGAQELTWTPREGDWSVVVMNADATSGVDVAVKAGAELPALPWVVGALLSLAGVCLVASILLVTLPLRAVRGPRGDR